MSCGAGSSVYCMSGFGNGVRNRGGGGVWGGVVELQVN